MLESSTLLNDCRSVYMCVYIYIYLQYMVPLRSTPASSKRLLCSKHSRYRHNRTFLHVRTTRAAICRGFDMCIHPVSNFGLTFRIMHVLEKLKVLQRYRIC